MLKFLHKCLSILGFTGKTIDLTVVGADIVLAIVAICYAAAYRTSLYDRGHKGYQTLVYAYDHVAGIKWDIEAGKTLVSSLFNMISGYGGYGICLIVLVAASFGLLMAVRACLGMLGSLASR